MSRIALLCAAFLLILSLYGNKGLAQSQNYFSNTLIIKYEDEETMSTIRSKSGNDPRTGIRTFLAGFGVEEPKPIYSGNRGNIRRKGSVSAAEDAVKELRRIHTLHYSSSIDPRILAAKVSRLPGIDYAEPKYIRYLQKDTDDAVENTFETFHRFQEAWDITTGSSDVVVAILDSGVGYNYPDLANKLWINGDEIPAAVQSQVDQNSDGTITAAEVGQYLQNNSVDYNGDGSINLTDALHPDSDLTTGSDTDGNGFDDDLFGWDFWASGYTPAQIIADNNPYLDASDHGSHVAGIAAAQPNNQIGIAGTGHNISYMAIKAGGIPDNTQTPGNEANAIAFGFEGIIYAVENGADIINCSWGGGGFSQAENDVVNFASDMGALVIGAAGNQGIDGVIYPAAYPNTMAVGSVELTDFNASYSNYGYHLDVLATGSSVQSVACEDPQNVTPDCNLVIGPKFGTSMSTPVVSGLAGLIKTLHPEWSPQHIATQIRATASGIDQYNNAELRNKLGKGKINAEEALGPGKPGLRVLNYQFLNSGGEKLGLEEDGEIALTIRNFGAPTEDLSLVASSLNGSGIEFGSQQLSIGQMSTDQTMQISMPIRITDEYDLANPVDIRLQFVDTNLEYDDFGVLPYHDLLFDVMDENRVKMSISADGTIGFTNALEGTGGIGYIPRELEGNDYVDGDNLLFEGGLILQMNGRIYDAVREGEGELSKDFDPETTFRLSRPEGNSYLQGTTFFNTDSTDLEARISHTSYAFSDPELSNVVFLQYEIENPYSFFSFENLYLGIFNDWDIGINAGANGTEFVEQDSILYVYDEDPQSNQPVVAVSHLGSLSSAFSIDNAAEGSGPDFGIYDDFTDDEKKTTLKAGTEHTAKSGADVSTVIASGPYTVSPRATATIGFIYAFGDDTEELRSQILGARSRAPFEVSQKGQVVTSNGPDVTRVFQNYPNPFNPSTRIRLDLAEPSNVNISIYNVLGRKVAEIVNEELDASIHIFNFNASNLSSGVYFARLTTDNRAETIKMLLVK